METGDELSRFHFIWWSRRRDYNENGILAWRLATDVPNTKFRANKKLISRRKNEMGFGRRTMRR